jgi:Ca2+-binding EF-hand superfamily protein
LYWQPGKKGNSLKGRKEKMNKTLSILCCVMLLTHFCVFAANSDIQMQEVKSGFQLIDADKNGFITPNEMQAYQEKNFNELDKDRNGVIDRNELTADKSKELNKADQNNDQKITGAESASQFKQYFNQLDANKDGKISEDEYTDYWKLRWKF